MPTTKIKLSKSVKINAFGVQKDGEGEIIAPGTYVKLSDIYVHQANNSRDLESEDYSDESIRSLAKEIVALDGLLNPVIITEIDASSETDFKDYMLVAGFRRIMALELLAEETGDSKWITSIFARVADIGGHSAYFITQAIENFREDLNCIETANLMEKIISESGKMTQKDLGDIFGLTGSTVSKYMKLLKLTDPIQKMISDGALSFSNASAIMSDEFDIEDSDALKIAKLGTRYTTSAFREILTKNYKKAEEGEDGKKAPSVTPQKPKQLVGKKVIENVYKTYLEGSVAKLVEDGDDELKFTKTDMQRIRLDFISTIFGNESQFSKEIEPFMADLKQKEEELKSKSSATKSLEKFLKAGAKKLKTLLDMPVDDEGNRPYPSVASALVKIQKDVKALKKSEVDELGFKFDPKKIDSYTKDILNTFDANRKNSKKRAAEAKAKKAKDKKEKEEAAKKD